MFARCADITSAGDPKLRNTSSTRSIARERLRKDLEEQCLAMFSNVEVDASGDACCKRIMQLLPQIEAVFEQLRLPFARHDFEAMVGIMDQDGSGGVDKGEFCRGVVQLAEGLQPISIIEIHCGVSFVKGQVSLNLQKAIASQAGIDEANRALTDLAQSVDLMNRDSAEAQDSMIVALRELERSVSEVRLAQHRAQAEVSLFRKDFREALAVGAWAIPDADQNVQANQSSAAIPHGPPELVDAPGAERPNLCVGGVYLDGPHGLLVAPLETQASALAISACQSGTAVLDPRAELQAEGGAVTAEAKPPCDVTDPFLVACPPCRFFQPLTTRSDFVALHSQELAERLRAALTSINAQLEESIEACEALLRGPSTPADGPLKTAAEEFPASPAQLRAARLAEASPASSAGRASRRSSPAVLARKAPPPKDMDPLSLGPPDDTRLTFRSSHAAGGAGEGSAAGQLDGSAPPASLSFSPASPRLQDGFLAALIAGGCDQGLAQLAAGDSFVPSTGDLLPHT